MESKKYLYDDNFVRYQLVKTNPGTAIYNWLFVPGGPGADSSYLLSLTQELDLPGNFWLMDLPANGDNISNQINANYNFETWDDSFLHAVQKFPNLIYVGHSFGGMFPLLFPQLEPLLKGFIVLNASPSLWLEEAARCAKENNLPLLDEPLAELVKNPNQETFKTALLACAPYYFPKNSIEEGKKLLEKLPVNYFPASWWQKKAREINFNAKWIPQNVPTLILGAEFDFITPQSIFKKDKRFQRKNITITEIRNAGHFPWLEQPTSVKAAFDSFFKCKLEVL
jgi:pimeloyl-ACP methyl ester carboxylesterase